MDNQSKTHSLNSFENSSKKRVMCLYRVSSSKQIDEDDIPLQREACHEYIEQHNDWVFFDEQYEKGVSGYSRSVDTRDKLQQIILDAQSNKFDILLIFATDRLCRIANEYTETLELLSQYIEIYTVDRGDITIRTHTDSLKTYVDGWQNQGESIKTSMRVDAKHKQMAEHGLFRGGIPPYGYKLVLSGKYSLRDKKQRKELYDIVVDETEAEVVFLMYKTAYELGYGQNRIAQYLNTKTDCKTRSGKPWSSTTIGYILKNPIYKGYPAYGKKTKKKKVGAKKQTQRSQHESKWTFPKKKIKKLEIVPEEMWNKVIEMRKSRANKGTKSAQGNATNLPTKGKLLFVGFIKCGYCGSPLVTTHHDKTWTNKDGTRKVKKYLKYRCSGKQNKKKDCEGATTHSQRKIEEPILQYVKDYLSQLKQYNFSNELSKEKNTQLKKYQKEIALLEKNKIEKSKDVATYEDCIPKALRGEGSFSPDLLNSLLKKANKELKDITKEIEDKNKKMESIKIETSDIISLQKALPKWEEIFNNAGVDQKKVMLSQIIKEIRIYRDRFEVDVKLHIEQFAKEINGVHNNIKRSPSCATPPYARNPSYSVS